MLMAQNFQVMQGKIHDPLCILYPCKDSGVNLPLSISKTWTHQVSSYRTVNHDIIGVIVSSWQGGMNGVCVLWHS